MGKMWFHRLKKEDFAHATQRLNVALDGRLEEMRKALSDLHSETENDPQLVELEETDIDRAGTSITLTNAEGENLLTSVSIDSLQKEAHSIEKQQC